MICDVVISARLLHWHKTHYKADLTCFSCGEKLVVGDKAVKRHRNSTGYANVPKTVFHHKKCFKRF